MLFCPCIQWKCLACTGQLFMGMRKKISPCCVDSFVIYNWEIIQIQSVFTCVKWALDNNSHYWVVNITSECGWVVSITSKTSWAPPSQPLSVSQTQRVHPQGWSTLTLMTVYYTETWPVSSAKQITAWLNGDSIHRDAKDPLWKLVKAPRQIYLKKKKQQNPTTWFSSIFKFSAWKLSQYCKEKTENSCKEGQSSIPSYSYGSQSIISLAS